jgi:hypothetical protein
VSSRAVVLSRAILSLGILWGAATFYVGVVSSRSLVATDLTRSVILLLCMFVLILPASVIAVWKPRIAALLLLILFLITEVTMLSEISRFELQGVRGSALFFGVPSTLLALGYVYVARARKKADRNSHPMTSSPREWAIRASVAGFFVPIAWGILGFLTFTGREGLFSRLYWRTVYITCPVWWVPSGWRWASAMPFLNAALYGAIAFLAASVRAQFSTEHKG